MDSEMEVIDGHMHLWSPETHPWLEKVRNGGHPAGKFEPIMSYFVEHYLEDVTGFNVTKCVHVQANMPDPIEETRWLDKLAEEGCGFPNGMAVVLTRATDLQNGLGISIQEMLPSIVGYCDLSGDNLEEMLTRHKSASNRVRGIRQMLNYHPDVPEQCQVTHDDYLTDPNWIQGYGLLENFQMSFDLQVFPWQMKRAADVVRQYPNIPCVVEHCGFPYYRDEKNAKLWRHGLQELSRYPNVYCKASGIGMFAVDPKWDRASLDSVVKPLFDMFGIDRVMFSSNLPVDNLNNKLPQLMSDFRDIVKPFTLEEQKKFFADNAKKFYRL